MLAPLTQRNKTTFLQVQSPTQLADFLAVSYKYLTYILYGSGATDCYEIFYVQKRNGEPREIFAPKMPIKKIQWRLKRMLDQVYSPKKSVYGFVKGKNIVDNAKRHVRRKCVLNIDIKDFYPSINFGRIYGLFMAFPFGFNKSVATILAQLCCYKGKLPQGAPTSPVLSNLICSRLDSALQALCYKHKVRYTRYADDMTFSIAQDTFPEEFVTPIDDASISKVQIGSVLNVIIKNNGFVINEEKTRLATSFQRQVVTGITVNKFTNTNRKFTRKLRALINDWYKNGEERAWEKYSGRKEAFQPGKLRRIVQGKIAYLEMVRGAKFIEDVKRRGEYNQYKNGKHKNDFRAKILSIEKRYSGLLQYDKASSVPLIITEGQTDWQHIKAAMCELGKTVLSKTIELCEYYVKFGESKLVRHWDILQRINKERTIICILDRDNEPLLAKHDLLRKGFVRGENNVFLMAIPKPKHRIGDRVCIEQLYKDEEITRVDSDGRRLFLKSEFNKRGYTTDEKYVWDKQENSQTNTIVSEKVQRLSDKKNVALAKSKFAKYVLNKTEPFHDFDFTSFEELFEVINQITS